MYQKTNAISEIKRVGKDSFWAKAEVSAVRVRRAQPALKEIMRARCQGVFLAVPVFLMIKNTCPH